jgi:hypothetical protein
MSNTNHPLIRKYTGRLVRSLKHLTANDRNDIIREIEAHIVEKWDADSKGSFDDESLRGVFGKMGSAEFIAAQYCEQRGWARSPVSRGVRNTILIVLGIIAAVVISSSFFASRYVIYPAIDLARQFVGDGESVVEIDDSGIRVFDGRIEVGDDGVRVRRSRGMRPGKGRGEWREGREDRHSSFRRGNGGLFSGNLLLEKSGELAIKSKGVEKIVLRNQNGRIMAKGRTGGDVLVQYIMKVYGKERGHEEEVMKKLNLNHSKSGDAINIEGVYPFGFGTYPDGISGVGYYIEITVPNGIAFELDSKNGAIELTGIGGDMSISSMNGVVNLNEAGGDVDVRNVNGFISIDDVRGGAKVSNKNGAINVSGVRGNIDIDSSVGSVDLVLSKGYGFKFVGTTKTGKIKADFPTTKSGSEYHATVGDGKHSIRVATKVGSVSVGVR